MNIAVIKINNLDQALMLSRAYKEEEIKLNVSKLAREWGCGYFFDQHFWLLSY